MSSETAALRRRLSQPSGYVSDATDCNDLNDAINSDAIEVCDGIDNNCDGDTDDDDVAIEYSTDDVFYADSDADGYGDLNFPIEACIQPANHVEDNTDWMTRLRYLTRDHLVCGFRF